jgi:hypothetical protein
MRTTGLGLIPGAKPYAHINTRLQLCPLYEAQQNEHRTAVKRGDAIKIESQPICSPNSPPHLHRPAPATPHQAPGTASHLSLSLSLSLQAHAPTQPQTLPDETASRASNPTPTPTPKPAFPPARLARRPVAHVRCWFQRQPPRAGRRALIGRVPSHAGPTTQPPSSRTLYKSGRVAALRRVLFLRVFTVAEEKTKTRENLRKNEEIEGLGFAVSSDLLI